MPRKPKVPGYCLHKQSGQAFVRLTRKNGKREFVYLGDYGSALSREKYERVVAEYLAARDGAVPSLGFDRRLTLAEIMVAYLRFAARHYVKDGHATSELAAIKAVLKRLRQGYGGTYADEFGPKALKALREQMIADEMVRGVINQNVGRVKRMFKWAASEELLSADVWRALDSVTGLQRGRTGAKEKAPIRPIDDQTVEKTCACLSPKLAAMVRLQRLLGCRPHEVCELQAEDFDFSRDVWIVRPGSHKTERSCPRTQLALTLHPPQRSS